jgi:hypothetical protein
VKGESNGELIFNHADGSSSSFVIPVASSTEDGLMSKEDKIKLDDVYNRFFWFETN